MSIRTHFRQHLLLALPIMISQLSHISASVSDSVMVGWLGATPLAASALTNGILWPFLALGMGISYGMTPLVAAADAREDYTETTQVLKHSLLINMGYALIFGTALILAAPLLHYAGQAPSVATLAVPYFRIVAFSLFPFMLFQTFREYAEALSFTREAMYINVGCSLVNIVLNYLLIYGKLGCTPMGLSGAGWATLISRTLMGLSMMGYVFGAPKLRQRLVAFRLKDFVPSYLTKIIRIGLPAGLECSVDGLACTATMVMAGWVSVEAQAAHTIAGNLTSVSGVIIWGIGLSTTIRVGNQVGLRNVAALRTAGFVGFGLGAALALVATIVFLGGRSVLPGFYTDDSVVLGIASTLLIVVGIQQLSDSADGVGVCALRGIEDTAIPLMITLVSRCLLGIPLTYILCFVCGWGVEGLWWGLFMAKLIAGMTLFRRFDRKSREVVCD